MTPVTRHACPAVVAADALRRWRWSVVLFALALGTDLRSARVVLPLQRRERSATRNSKGHPDSARLGQQRRLKSLATGSHPVDLGNYDNVQYHLELFIGQDCDGKGMQRFEVVPDTGSSDVWIPSKHCPKCKPGSRRYDISQSCSSSDLGDRVHFRYGDGTAAAGLSFEDTVKIGDLKLEHQYLIRVDDMEDIEHMKSDGILGLAHHYDSGNSEEGRSFLHSFFSEQPHLPRHFSFFLTAEPSEPSKLVLGDADIGSNSKEDNFRYGKSYYMSHTSLWLTSVWSIGWSGTGVEVSFPDRGTLGAPALVDSGSSLIVVRPDIFDKLTAELKWRFTGCSIIPEQQILSCDCPPGNDLSRIPSLVINIINDDNEQFSLCMSGEEYILESRDVPGVSGYASCVPALQRGSDSQPVPLIFGMTFMRTFYTTFDVKRHRIGFARSIRSTLPANASCSATSSPPPERRAVWLASVLMAIGSIIFATHVLLWPLCCSCADTKGGGIVAPTA